MDLELLAADLRDRAFGLGSGAASSCRLGAEVELIPVSAETQRALPIHTEEGLCTLVFLRRFARERGWSEQRLDKGLRFLLPGGGIVGYEPGGQIEFSTPPFHSAAALLEALRAVVLPLRAAAREEGIELLSVGIDPHTPLEQVPLQLCGARYLQMTHYFEQVEGAAGAGVRMMRQTAAFQLSLDFPDEALLGWRVLNAAAPYLVAIFANSPLYAGAATGYKSYRARTWRELDPARTGIFPGDAPVAEYLDFALRAPAMLEPTAAGEYLPYRELLARGESTFAGWRAHLSTLFPEVRPRGHLEVRSLDAVEPAWCAAPIALLVGILYDRESLHAAADLLGPPDAGALRRAGEVGLGEVQVAGKACDLFEIGLRGAAALGSTFIDPADLEAAGEFFARYTRRARSPADDLPLAARMQPGLPALTR